MVLVLTGGSAVLVYDLVGKSRPGILLLKDDAARVFDLKGIDPPWYLIWRG